MVDNLSEIPRQFSLSERDRQKKGVGVFCSFWKPDTEFNSVKVRVVNLLVAPVKNTPQASVLNAFALRLYPNHFLRPALATNYGGQSREGIMLGSFKEVVDGVLVSLRVYPNSPLVQLIYRYEQAVDSGEISFFMGETEADFSLLQTFVDGRYIGGERRKQIDILRNRYSEYVEKTRKRKSLERPCTKPYQFI